MPDGQAMMQAVDPSMGRLLAALQPVLRVEDAGLGMACLAVNQVLSHDLARHIATLLREGSDAGTVGARCVASGGVAALAGRIGSRRRLPLRYRRWMMGS